MARKRKSEVTARPDSEARDVKDDRDSDARRRVGRAREGEGEDDAGMARKRARRDDARDDADAGDARDALRAWDDDDARDDSGTTVATTRATTTTATTATISTSARRMRDARAHEALLRAFHGGDVAKILRECRHANNEAYDDDDVEAATEALTRDGTTVNAPFCFTAGAIALKRALHLEAWARLRGGEFRGRGGEIFGVAGGCVGYGECEVGVYASRADGDVAEWHRDVCDNATIQLIGKKQWEVEVYVDGRDGTEYREELRGKSRNASASDEAACGADYVEQYWAETKIETCVIGPGDTICVPRGRLHRVVPLGEDVSVSADIRMTTIESAEIAAEIAYLKAIALYDERSVAVKQRAVELPPIHWLPFEEEFSDGLVLGARLEYVVAAAANRSGTRDDVTTYEPVRRYDDTAAEGVRERAETLRRSPTAAFHPSCACSVRDDDERGDYHVLNVKATSALTNKDLMSEFNIYVRRDSVREGEMCAFNSPVDFIEAELGRLERQSPERANDRRLVARETGEFSDAVSSLRGVLYDANILLPPGNDWWFFWCNTSKRLSDAHPSGLARRGRAPDAVRIPGIRESIRRRTGVSQN